MNKISVIIPVFNVEKYLNNCIDSVLNQTYAPYEIIIVDDGSTDNSGKIADKYKELYSEKIKVIHQENKGLGGARNTGIEQASGEYFLFLDSDDTIESNVLWELDKEISRTKAEMVVYGIQSVNEKGEIEKNLISEQPKHQKLLLNNNKSILFELPSAANKVYHRNLFIKTGIRFPSRVWYEDIRTITKLYLFAKGISYTDKCSYRYLRRSGSIMNNSNMERNLEIISAFEDIITYYKYNNFFDEYQQELEFLAIKHVLIAAIVRINKVKIRKDLINIIMKYIKNEFPNYLSNKYLTLLTPNERIVLVLITTRMYWLIYLIFHIKK